MHEDIGSQAVRQIHELWQIDEDRCVWHENGFDWWPGNFRQSIRVSEPQERDGLTAYRLFAKTDFLKGVSDDMQITKLMLDAVSRFAPSYAMRSVPTDFFENGDEDEKHKISLVSTCYVNDESFGYLPSFFGRMAIMQPINSQIQAAGLSESFGGEADMSLPPGANEQLPPDEMLEIIASLYVPEGQKSSRWQGSDEFESIAENFGRSDMCFGSGDPGGLTLETPFGNDSFLIRLFTDQKHPQLGNGLLATLQVPYFPERAEAERAVVHFNFLESISFTFFPIFGGWQLHETGDECVGPAFSSFVPNILYQPGLATNMALWMLGRARWIKDQFWPEVEDRTMQEIMETRLQVLDDKL